MTPENPYIAKWQRWPAGYRWAVLGTGLAVCATVVLLMAGALRTEYAVLFARLNEQDAASIVSELRRLKVPYRLEDAGESILVPEADVYETRMSLTSAGTPLAGGVGFELFDNQGFGATEQSQRITYQRALQGELARTIAALEPVRQARVHLVMPETTLFRRDREQARAAVVLAFEPGRTLAPEQVSGIQRLVAASVEGLESSRVVVSDEQGVVLNLVTLSGQRSPEVTAFHLSLKREVEIYLTDKVARLLDGTFGPGKAIVSIDATLNFDEITRTHQRLLPAGTAGDSGYILREQQANTATGTQSEAVAIDYGVGGDTTANRSVEYEFGRSVEQVVTAPGSISRLSIAVVVPATVPPDQQARIGNLVQMAAGVDRSRGDAVVVQALDEIGVVTTTSTALAQPSPELPAGRNEDSLSATVPISRLQSLPLVTALMLLLVGVLVWSAVKRRRSRPISQMLSEKDRVELLAQLRASLQPTTLTPKR